MPKSKIIVDVVNGSVSLEQSLRRLEVLAHDVGNKELELWAECELGGYGEQNVPEYRVARNCLSFTYSGINGYALKVENVPLSITLLSKETLDAIKDIPYSQGIAFMTKMAEGGSMTYLDRSVLAAEVTKTSKGALQCYSIRQGVPASFYVRVVSEVTTRLIKALTMLEEQYGILDDLGIVIESGRRASENNSSINSVVLNYSGGAPDKEEKLGSKVAWNVLTPIVSAVLGAVLSALAVKYFGL